MSSWKMASTLLKAKLAVLRLTSNAENAKTIECVKKKCEHPLRAVAQGCKICKNDKACRKKRCHKFNTSLSINISNCNNIKKFWVHMGPEDPSNKKIYPSFFLKPNFRKLKYDSKNVSLKIRSTSPQKLGPFFSFFLRRKPLSGQKWFLRPFSH